MLIGYKITGHLSQLNKNMLITSRYDQINLFKQKISLWKIQINKENLYNFSSCKSLLLKYSELKYDKYDEQPKMLEENFEKRFLDFKSTESNFDIFCSPMSVDIENIDENLQMEFIELRCDTLLK